MNNKSIAVFAWFLQAIASLLLFFFFVGPIFQITFQNGGHPVSYLPVLILSFFVLLPFWAAQLFATHINQAKELTRKLLIWLGSYLLGTGSAFAIAWSMTSYLHTKKILRIGATLVLTVCLTLVFFLVLQLYLVVFGDVFTRLLLRS